MDGFLNSFCCYHRGLVKYKTQLLGFHLRYIEIFDVVSIVP